MAKQYKLHVIIPDLEHNREMVIFFDDMNHIGTLKQVQAHKARLEKQYADKPYISYKIIEVKQQ